MPSLSLACASRTLVKRLKGNHPTSSVFRGPEARGAGGSTSPVRSFLTSSCQFEFASSSDGEERTGTPTESPTPSDIPSPLPDLHGAPVLEAPKPYVPQPIGPKLSYSRSAPAQKATSAATTMTNPSFATSVNPSLARPMRPRRTSVGAYGRGTAYQPYQLHVRATKNNTILTLTTINDVSEIEAAGTTVTPSIPINSIGLSAYSTANQRNVNGLHREGTVLISRGLKKIPVLYEAVWTETCGMASFKGTARGTFEAAVETSRNMFRKIAWLANPPVGSLNYDVQQKLAVGQALEKREIGIRPRPTELEIIFKGFGKGREAVISTLVSGEGELIRPLVTRFTDQTPVQHGSTRAKRRRVV